MVLERTRFVMGTSLRIVVEASDRARALAATDAAFEVIARVEAQLSTWDPASDVSELNASSIGDPVAVGAELLARLLAAESWARRTDRAFDPEVGPLVEVWDLRGAGRIPDPIEVGAALAASGGRGFAIDRAAGTVTRLHDLAWMDTGAWAKGAALAAARDALARQDIVRATLDFGGQVLVATGRGAGGSPDHVAFGVADPSRRSDAICVIALVAGESAATSGFSERLLTVGDEALSHVLDPRTGRPSPPWGSVTVVSTDPLAADALATALYVMGPDEGLAWARSLHEAVLVLDTRDGAPVPRWNPAMDRRMRAAGNLCPGSAQGDR